MNPFFATYSPTSLPCYHQLLICVENLQSASQHRCVSISTAYTLCVMEKHTDTLLPTHGWSRKPELVERHRNMTPWYWLGNNHKCIAHEVGRTLASNTM